MRSSQVQSLKMTTAVCLALAIQLFSVVNVHAAAVGARTNSAVSSGSRPNDSERADLESAIRPTPANPVEDEDAYAEYLADQIISFCERISKIPSQTGKLTGKQKMAQEAALERCVEELMASLNKPEEETKSSNQ